jgi:hypothetical protein
VGLGNFGIFKIQKFEIFELTFFKYTHTGLKCQPMKTKEEIVNNWLPRYTGEQLQNFGKYILLTNFHSIILNSEYICFFKECIPSLHDLMVSRAWQSWAITFLVF